MRVDGKIFTEEHLNALSFFNEKHGQKYFTLLHRGVRFRQYVGVLQVGQLTIEILPKTDQFPENHQHWQQFLIDLLYACNFVNVDALSKAPLQLKTSPLLWLYLELFVNEIEELLRKGLKKSYHQEETNANSWKGKVQFARHLQKNLMRPQKVYTRLQTYDYQHPVHQVLYKALTIVHQFWISPTLKNKIQYLLKTFPKQADITVSNNLFYELYDLQAYKSYHKALDLARMITFQHSPDIRVGQYPVLAILFDMNLLFEEFIYNQLKKSLKADWTIRAQPSRRFWGNRMVRPDIWLRKGDENYIIDTKWKILQQPSPSDEDLKQIFTYNHLFEATRSLLVYPNAFQLKSRAEKYIAPLHLKGEEKPHYCQVVFVDILDEKGQLNQQIAGDLVKYLS